MTVVGIILLIACSNIAGLLLARGASRQKEMATRLAIGAARGRLVRQLLTESVLLSAAGGLAGVTLAWLLNRSTQSLLGQLMPIINGVDRNLGVAATPDIRVLVFSAAVVLFAAVVFGLAPAMRTTHVDLLSMMKQTGAGGRRRRFSFTSGKAMVALQTALSMLLLIGAGLFIRTVVNLRSVELGYQPEGLLYVRVEPRAGGMQRDTSSPQAVRDSSIRRAAFFEDVVKHLASAPAVLSASASLDPPLSSYEGAGASSEPSNACTSDFNAEPPDGAFVIHSVAPRFFETMRLPLLLGRDFEWSDRVALSRQRVAVVTQSFVNKFFAPGRNPIGATFGVGRDCPNNTSFLTVIGVVADSKTLPRTETGPATYQLYSTPARPLTVILRTSGDPARLVPVLRKTMADSMQKFRC